MLTLETGEGNEWVTDIQRQVARLTDLTNELMDLARLEEPRGGGNFLPFSFSDLVEETAQSFQALARSQGKGLALSIQPRLTLVGEEKRLAQLVSLLLDNAVKYAPPGDEITLRLTVTNAAPGLSREVLENMFDRFYRGDKARSSQRGGYGIGLAVAKAVVQAHRGRITAAAQAGRLVMTVVLPEAPAWGPRPG